MNYAPNVEIRKIEEQVKAVELEILENYEIYGEKGVDNLIAKARNVLREAAALAFECEKEAIRNRVKFREVER